MIFFNSHKKTGREIGATIKQTIHQIFIGYNKAVPEKIYQDKYIYGYITASATNLMAYVFGGKDWSQQKKGECIIEALSIIDPSGKLLDFHVDNNVDPEKFKKLNSNKDFKQGMNDATTFIGVVYGFLKPDDPDPILKEAKKMSEKTEDMSYMFGGGDRSPNAHLGGCVTMLTLFGYIKKKYLK